MRQTGGVVCRLRKQIAHCTSPEEGRVEKSLSYHARREVLHQMAPQYRQASPSQKRTLLEAFIATTGYVREGQQFVERVLQRDEGITAPLRAKVLVGAGWLAI